MSEKKCKRCQQVKTLTADNFYKSPRAKNGFRSWCIACSKEEAANQGASRRCRYTWYSQSANRRGHEFSLTQPEFESFWQKPCHYCGAEIQTIGLDRLNNNSGYEISNVVPCCSDCNYAKRELSADEFVALCSAVHNKQNFKYFSTKEFVGQHTNQ